MNIAVSPYHMTTRELPAMAALLLAARVVTFMPGVFKGDEVGGRDSVGAAARGSARYVKLVESWGWSMPLWQDGVIESSFAGDDASGDVRAVWDRLATDDRYSALRPFIRLGFGEDREEFIEAVAKDVLKGGPDPSISVPLLAGLDRFSSRHGLVVARAEPSSVAQKAEAAFADPVVRVVLPLILQGSSEAVMFAREELAEELEEFRTALQTVGSLALEVPRVETAAMATATASMMRAALAFERAFSQTLPLMEARQDRDEVKLKAGPVSISLVRLPADAVLRSSCNAARTVLSPGKARRPASRGAGPVETLPVLADVLDHGSVLAMVVKQIGVATKRR